MDLPLIIIFLGVLIVAAHVFNVLFDKIRIPNALLLTIVGILIGPIFHIVRLEHFGKVGPVFTNITLIIIIFTSGLNLKLKELGSAIGPSLIFSLLNFFTTAGIITVIAYMSGASDWVTASFIGAILGGTSSAVVIPMIKQVKVNAKAETMLLLESALTDVLCLVLGLTMLSALKEGVFSAATMGTVLWQSFTFAAILGLLAAFLWAIFLGKIGRLANSTMLNLAVVFVVSGVADKLGWNGGIAALIFGITLGNIHLLGNTFMRKLISAEESENVEKGFLDEIAFVLQTYFFVFLGVSIQFGNVWVYVLAVISVVLILALRPIAVKASVWSKMPINDLSIMSVMMPKGLVPAILASIPLQLGLLNGEFIRDFAYSVVLVSLVVCSVLVILIFRNLYFPQPLKFLFGRIVAEESGSTGEGQPASPQDQNINPENPPSS